jgi:hypothetical protein
MRRLTGARGWRIQAASRFVLFLLECSLPRREGPAVCVVSENFTVRADAPRAKDAWDD